jgi:putative transposase
MKYTPKIHHRRSIRLKEYDYSQEGGYFITLCSQNRKCVFGEIKDGVMRLSSVGDLAAQCWSEIPAHFENAELDEFVVMPNHIHGIIILKSLSVGVQYIEPRQRREPQRNQFQGIIPKSVGSIIRSYKAAVTRQCRLSGFTDFQWQRNYYEHVIRDLDDLARIREYIANNVLQWYYDEENLENVKTQFV